MTKPLNTDKKNCQDNHLHFLSTQFKRNEDQVKNEVKFKTDECGIKITENQIEMCDSHTNTNHEIQLTR